MISCKKVLFRVEARERVLRGAPALTDAVRVTLGPKYKCVQIGKKWGTQIVCNDGVTIAKEFELRDPTERLGDQMMRQAAEKTSDAVGDGTTTATLVQKTRRIAAAKDGQSRPEHPAAIAVPPDANRVYSRSIHIGGRLLK